MKEHNRLNERSCDRGVAYRPCERMVTGSSAPAARACNCLQLYQLLLLLLFTATELLYLLDYRPVYVKFYVFNLKISHRRVLR
jgi:hypothetical protein